MTAAEPGAANPHFGLKLPNCGGIMYEPGWATPETLDALAAVGVDEGYDSVWLHDHILTPAELKHLGPLPFLDPIVVATHLATRLPRVQIGFATLVLPLREPVVLAKQLATLARFFPGRIIAGIGAGRYRSEFESYGTDTFDERGRVTREYLALVNALLADGPTTFEGTRRSVRDADQYPKPGPGDLAVWLAAQAPGAIARAGREAAGWITAGLDVDEFAAACGHYREGLEAGGRSWSDRRIALSLTLDVRDEADRQGAELHRHSYALGGSAADVATELRRYAEAGVTHFLLAFSTDKLGTLSEQIRWFAREVRPKVSLVRA